MLPPSGQLHINMYTFVTEGDSSTFRTFALSETRYKKSDICEIYVVGSGNSAGLTGGPPRGGEPKTTPP